MASQKVVCWNSAGIRASTSSTSEKLAFFNKEFPNANFAIAAFIETHHKNVDEIPEEFKEFETTHNIVHTPAQNETHSGIIVLISKEHEIITQTEVIPGRLLNVKIRKNLRDRNISVFYGPQWAKMKKENIIETLNYFHEVHKISDRNIILGDFNFADNDLDKGRKMDNRD